MNTQIIAALFQQGGTLLTECIRNGFFKRAKVEQTQSITVENTTEPEPSPEGKATSIASGCIPCALGHFGTCTGLLNESMRFARDKGLDSDEAVDRIGHCLQELNALEREDLTSENIVTLPPWQKELAVEALNASRQTRHILEGATTVDDLEQAVADTQTFNTSINRRWFKERLKRMPKEEKTKLVERTVKGLEE